MADPPPEPLPDSSGEKPPPTSPSPPPPPAEEEEGEEYESDPDDAPLPAMRRREASDDEGSEAGKQPPPPRGRIGSDPEEDGQGTAEVYEDELDDEEEEYYDEEEEEEEEEVGEGFEEEYGGDGGAHREVAGGEGLPREEAGVEGEKAGEGEAEGEGEEKKENEPYAVPTAGAFYMHDDRFQEDGRGRRRRMFGGRKLWDAKDDQAWVHDRFEEMKLQDERYEDKRMSRGHFRGRGGGSKTRGTGRGFSRGGRYRGYHHEDGNSQNRAPKVVRGRGPRRYESVAKNSHEVVGPQRKQSARSREPVVNAAAVRDSAQVSIAQPEVVPPKKNVLGSNLNSASPPFYPSGTSNQDFPIAQRRDIQSGGSNKVLPSSMKMDDNMKLQSGSTMRGRTVTDSGGRDRLYVDDSVRPSPARTVATSVNSSGFTVSSVNPGQSPSARAQGRSANTVIPSNNLPTSSLHQISRFSTQQQSNTSAMHQKPIQVSTQPATRMPAQQLSHRTGNQSSAAPQHPSVRSTEGGQSGSYPGSNNSMTPSTGVGKTNSQETKMGSFGYSGAQVIGATGAVGLSQGEQNFPGTPALLPVMQFGSQHSGGMGIPAVGMALPGYVAQQQLGLGNNEMTWLPVLAGAAGNFGASYPPYIALDASFYSRSSGQTLSTSSREPIGSKGAKSPPRNVTVNEEVDQRQNKPRRYSEMNFGQ